MGSRTFVDFGPTGHSVYGSAWSVSFAGQEQIDSTWRADDLIDYILDDEPRLLLAVDNLPPEVRLPLLDTPPSDILLSLRPAYFTLGNALSQPQKITSLTFVGPERPEI